MNRYWNYIKPMLVAYHLLYHQDISENVVYRMEQNQTRVSVRLSIYVCQSEVLLSVFEPPCKTWSWNNGMRYMSLYILKATSLKDTYKWHPWLALIGWNVSCEFNKILSIFCIYHYPPFPLFSYWNNGMHCMSHSQITKNLTSILIRHRFDTYMSDRSLIDVDPRVFTIWAIFLLTGSIQRRYIGPNKTWLHQTFKYRAHAQIRPQIAWRCPSTE